MAAQALADLDPTGTLSAAGAAVGLVGAVLRTVPALKNATNAVRSQSGSSKGPEPLHRAQSTEAPVLGVDSSREKRAYETVNFVLRELGTRICAAGLVNERALEKALTVAAQHVEVNLFSGETNRLFASLAPKLTDAILVNAVFTSIYFIGALTAELARSLPNYKESYTPLGPWIVQQLFRTAIGEDAFRENLTANLDAYKTVVTTAGLLRPTDIGYSSFPGFPALSPTRYSNRSFGEVHKHKSTYDKLVKHFDRFGFPQPIVQKQSDVGLIRDWRFLDGDSPSRYYDVEKADKNIGQTFGRVLHWLICSADRMPPGQAVIAYYLQHIELIKWIGYRMGYSILYGATDLDMSGAHSKLDKNCRGIFSTWVILMPSERAQATRRASSASWAQTHPAQIPPIPLPQPQRTQQQSLSAEFQRSAENAPIVVPIVQPQALPNQPPQPQGPQNQGVPWHVPQSTFELSQSPQHQSRIETVQQPVPQGSAPSATSPPPKTIDERLDDVARNINEILVPQCESFLSMPPTEPSSRLFEYRRLTQHIEKNVINWLDGIPIPDGDPARNRRKEMIIAAQRLLQSLDDANRPPSVPTTPSIVSTASVAGPPSAATFIPNVTASSAVAAFPVEKPSVSTPPTSPILDPSQQFHAVASASPPPYSPNTPPSAISPAGSNPASYPFPAKKPIRRKAPPPPKKLIAAKALYDFEPEEDNDEELAFKEGDDLEIVEKTPALEEEGWCRARVKGQKRLGLAPLEYLEIEEKAPSLNPTAHTPSLSAAPPPHGPSTAPPAAVDPVPHELHGSDGQTQSGTTSADHIPDTASSGSTMYASSPYPSYPPSGYPSAYPSAYSSDPHSYPTHENQGPHHASKMGKKIEMAKLAVGATGAVAGIAGLVDHGQSSDSQSASGATAQQEPVTQNVTVNEQNDPMRYVQSNYDMANNTQNTYGATDLTQNNIDTTNVMQNNNNNNNNNNTTTTIQPTNSPPIIPAPPLDPTPTAPSSSVDLSAYSTSPFDPQLPLDASNPLMAPDPFVTSFQTPTLASAPDLNLALVTTDDETVIYQDSSTATTTSPFAGIATQTTFVETVDTSAVMGMDDEGDYSDYDQGY